MRRLAAALALLAALAPLSAAGPGDGRWGPGAGWQQRLAPSAYRPAYAQRADGLDTPLRWANMCGAGDPRDVHFTIAATGDTFPHENIQAAGESYGYDYLFDYVRPFLQAADLAYTNFDGAMLEGSPSTGYPAFNYSPKLAEALRRAGIGLVSTANNHILDRGPEGLDATLAVLARSGIAQHGAIPTTEAAGPRPPYLPITLARDDATVTIGFISASWGTNGLPDPYGQVNLLWESNSYGGQGGVRQSVLDAIAQAGRETDLVVVAAHWGEEYQFYPQPYQLEGARRMAEAGADVILGAQSHTLQPVDIIDAGGRRALVAYSLANFLASQGAFQQPYYSATSVILYLGLVRQADGVVRVTGYRYLPTLHVDGDTRPAPLPASEASVTAHVRQIMRDPAGLRQLPPHPPAGRVEVCPAIGFAETPGVALGGDFAQHYATLGGGLDTREPRETIAVLGLPLGPPARGLAADCARATVVLTTERQRLEWDPSAPWPYRVLGARLGAEAYQRRYGDEPPPRTDLTGGAFGDERLRAFFERYGGLPVFGYPLSGLLAEPDPVTGRPVTVQYFERARLELASEAPPGADLLAQVRVAPLGREALAEGWGCWGTDDRRSTTEDQTPTADDRGLRTDDRQSEPALSASEGTDGQPAGDAQHSALSAQHLALILLALAALTLAGALAWRTHRRLARRAGARPVAWRSWQHGAEEDEDLLRRLLER
ncbi:MAG TPA: CapA family protein [Roseiflexaceae bacterium]|nr:CapA family protein [Roseiflexaceae bacterium]